MMLLLARFESLFAFHLEQLERPGWRPQFGRRQAAAPDAAGIQRQGIVSEAGRVSCLSDQCGPVSERDGRVVGCPSRNMEPGQIPFGRIAGTFGIAELHHAFG